jgi:hypothetical protein
MSSTEISDSVAKFNLSHQLDILGHVMANGGYLNVQWLIDNKHTAAQFELMKREGLLKVIKKDDWYVCLCRSEGVEVIRVRIMRKKLGVR